MIKIGDLLKKNQYGQIVFFCPECRAPCNFDEPNSMNVWSCYICNFTITYYGKEFLTILAEYKEKDMTKRELFKIVAALKGLCRRGDMATVKINSIGNVSLSVGMSNYPVMTVSEFVTFMEKRHG